MLGLPCFLILPESPRWLANNGRKESCEEVLLKIAKWNRREVTLDQRQEIRAILSKIEREAHQTSEENLNILNMFRNGNLKKTLILLLNWITVCVGSYTLLLNSTKLSGDLFINYSLSVVLGDLPGTFALMVTMKYFGRRFNMFYVQTVVGLCCLVLAFTPKTVSIS